MSRKLARKPPLWGEVFDDASKRASDIINLHLAANEWDDIKDKFIAIRLSDGSSDDTLYDSKRDAVRHVPDERWYAFLCFRNLRGGSNPREMQRVLDFFRMAYSVTGGRLADPDSQTGGPDILPTTEAIDYVVGRRFSILEANVQRFLKGL